MRAGRLRERIDIYQEVTTINSDYGAPENTFSLYASTRADVRFLNGTELIQGGAVSNSTNALFTLRFREGIDETMQIEYRGDRYNIRYIEENRKNEVLRLTASKILN